MGSYFGGPRLSTEQVRECRAIIRGGSKSFYFASLVLPAEVREAAFALYAFCRVSDDIADCPTADRRTILELGERLEAAYRGCPYPFAPDRALSQVVAQYDIPLEVMRSMLEGFDWDISGRGYETLEDLVDYAARVAGTVGVMMTVIMKRRSARTLARAADLGVAMQLTNIARDVGEDARDGRLYLPRDWMRQEGLDPDGFVANPVFSAELGRVVRRLLDSAQAIYSRSLTGLADLPAACRPGICAAALVYSEIGAEIRRNGYDSVSWRARTSRLRKATLLARSLTSAFAADTCDESPPLLQAAYLVKAAALPHINPVGSGERLLDLIVKLNHRDTALVPQGGAKQELQTNV